jgi:hypothetical protein
MNPKWRENELLENHVSSRAHENICGKISMFWDLFLTHSVILSIIEPRHHSRTYGARTHSYNDLVLHVISSKLYPS